MSLRGIAQIILISSREDFIINQYISGLDDLEIKKYVQFAHLSTLDKAFC